MELSGSINHYLKLCAIHQRLTLARGEHPKAQLKHVKIHAFFEL
jgi:hypothetical protein